MQKLDYCLRWAGTAISFALFGIGGLVQGLLIHPVIWLLVRDPQHRRRLSRRVVGASMALFVGTMKALGVLDYDISGRENARAGRNYLIVANHPSLIDVVFLLSLFPDADCVVKEAMARNPFFYALIRSAGYISNDDSVAMIYHSVERLKDGNSLIIFPEGTRTRSGGRPEFSCGAAAIAVRSGCECLPVFIDCDPVTLTRQDHWYLIPDRKVQFSVAIQPPLQLAAPEAAADDARQTTELANRELQDYFLQGLSG